MILHRGCAPLPELKNYNSCYGNFNGRPDGAVNNYNSCYEKSKTGSVLRRNNFLIALVALATYRSPLFPISIWPKKTGC